MKVGIFSPYLDSLGGGERYVLTVAEFFILRGDHVDLFWKGELDKDKIKSRFNINLQKANLKQDIFFNGGSFLTKILETLKYDLLFFLSDGSIPTSLAKKNWLHFQVPFKLTNQNTLINKLKLLRINDVICNSNFTKRHIDKTFGVNSLVIYPPVDVTLFKPGKKAKTILSVGRFAQKDPKNHEIMVQTFINMVKNGLKDWKLALLGSVLPNDLEEVEKIKKMTSGFPVEVKAGLNYESLKTYFSQASIYWHAAGFGQDLDKHPEHAEHFGITTVEAMSAGCVPIVFEGGGQREIITSKNNGLFWTTPKELIEKTNLLINDSNLLDNLSTQAILTSKKFSKESFYEKLSKLLK